MSVHLPTFHIFYQYNEDRKCVLYRRKCMLITFSDGLTTIKYTFSRLDALFWKGVVFREHVHLIWNKYPYLECIVNSRISRYLSEQVALSRIMPLFQ
jgi:hypothetical protein